ncbi:hypothetical protein [Clostridium sp. YIM B02555]|uniref:hypothetical protein n=1 Tax=Clostridium sp. YIM B02555 TaxID=2911968 RepID=UPI001EED27C2|nr:hypothetical protein [Clostridium sp. YIM B02555]
MINNIYLTLIILFLISISVITFITDFNYGKILNKHLGLFMKIGLIIQLLYSMYLILYEKQIFNFSGYIINLLIGTLISICLYYFDIWGAGDSKYVILILLVEPINIFQNNGVIAFQGLMLYIFTFTMALIYLCGESLYFFYKEVPTLERENFFRTINIKEFLLKWLYSFSIITIIYKIIDLVSRGFLNNNVLIIRFLVVILMFYFLDKMKKKGVVVITVILAVVATLVDYFIKGYSSGIIIDYKILFLVLIIIIIRNLCSRYNYKKIKTISVEEGMVLSAGTFIGFINSRVKGLPAFKSESIHSRITVEEAESVKRWAKSKYGQEHIYIVRQIPFAAFISLGATLSILHFII